MTSSTLQCACLRARGSATAVTTLQHTALHPFILHSTDQCKIRGQTTSSAARPCVSASEGVSSSFPPLACNCCCLEAKSLAITVCSRFLSGDPVVKGKASTNRSACGANCERTDIIRADVILNKCHLRMAHVRSFDRLRASRNHVKGGKCERERASNTQHSCD